MKKLIILVIFLFNLVPYISNHKIVIGPEKVFAQDEGDEDWDITDVLDDDFDDFLNNLDTQGYTVGDPSSYASYSYTTPDGQTHTGETTPVYSVDQYGNATLVAVYFSPDTNDDPQFQMGEEYLINTGANPGDISGGLDYSGGGDGPSSGSDSGDDPPDPPDNPPPPSCTGTLSSSTDKQTVLPGGIVNLKANFQPPYGATNIQYEYEVLDAGKWMDVDNGTPSAVKELPFQTRTLGTIKFIVEVTFVCGGANYGMASQPFSVEVKICSADLLTNFANDMNTAYANTLASTASGSGKYEDGFSADFNGVTLTYSVNTASNSGACGVAVTDVTLTSTRPTHPDPLTGDIFTVFEFHTHPPLTNCSSNESRIPGPSTIDFQLTNPFPMYVRDYVNRVTGGDPAVTSSNPTQNYSFGTDCTTYP